MTDTIKKWILEGWRKGEITRVEGEEIDGYFYWMDKDNEPHQELSGEFFDDVEDALAKAEEYRQREVAHSKSLLQGYKDLKFSARDLTS